MLSPTPNILYEHFLASLNLIRHELEGVVDLLGSPFHKTVKGRLFLASRLIVDDEKLPRSSELLQIPEVYDGDIEGVLAVSSEVSWRRSWL